MPVPVSSPVAPRRRFNWPVLAFGGAVIGLLIAYPPVRFISKQAAATTTAALAENDFAPGAFAETFWSTQLQPAVTAAPPIGPVLADLRRDPAAAAKAHAHQVGLGNASTFFVRGSGRVTAVERNQLLLVVDGATIALRTGPVFGNVVRDGCGLLDVNQVPGLAEFNAVSAEINRLIEERVQPALKTGVEVGATITFAGCAQAPETLPTSGPLLLFIPVQAEVSP